LIYKKIFLLILLFICVKNLDSQILTPLDVQILDVDGVKYKNQYVGTLTSPQFSEEDFNGDGLKDLFVFDRRGDTPLVFLYSETEGYIHAPDYGAIFPKTLHSWVIIKDYNGDGIGDIFTAPTTVGIPGIEVFIGKRSGDSIYYTLLDHPNEFNSLDYPSGNNQIIIYVAFSDFPGIEDIDSDGDIDIITFDPGGSIARLYRNYAVERFGRVDTFDMELNDFCWGKFKENDFSSELSLSEDPNVCAVGLREIGNVRHSGSTLAFIDKNRDGIHDLLLGDLANEFIAFLENGGNNIEAWMNRVDVTFPSYNVPIAVDFFSNTFTIDIDKDGLKDILAAPNSRLANPGKENIWYYQDIGKDTAEFNLVKKDFLLDDALVMGGFSSPALIDIDMDKDLDIIVGVRGLKNEENDVVGALYLFENISNGNELAFQLIDDDFLGMRSLFVESGNYAPATGDLDGDKDIDIIIGDREGKLFYFENKAMENQAPIFEGFTYEYQAIDVGQNAKPQIIDVNMDGLVDLVVGERNDNKEGNILGGVNLFVNKGSSSSPSFDPNTSTTENTSVMGGIFTRDPGVSVGSSSPWLFYTVEALLAIVGSESGQVKLYDNLLENIYGQSNLVSGEILPFNIGGNTTITGGDLNGNNLLDVIIGSNLGSLYFYETTYRLENSVFVDDKRSFEFKVSPNPSSGIINITSAENIDAIQLFSVEGQLISTYTSNSIAVDISDGIYFLKLFSGTKTATKKILIVND
jgi:hypothetical protein